MQRTDSLAVRLGCDVQDLVARLGISRRTLFAARSDDAAASPKTWLKLEAAERAAGIGVDSVPEHPAEPPALVVDAGSIEERLDRIEARQVRMEAMLAEVLRR